MFIELRAKRRPLRSKERNAAREIKLYLTSAPSNGAGGVLFLDSMNMSPLAGWNLFRRFQGDDVAT
jgi:hypothetical protein